MLKFIIKRLINLIPTLLIVAVIVFVITRIIPGDPASVMLGPQASASDIHRLKEQLGLNDSMIVQFIHYLNGLIHLDLGESFAYKQSVLTLIIERFPNTLILTICAFAFALLISIPAGVIAATRKGSLLDYAFTVTSLFGISIPVFWLGLMLVLLFSVTLGWLPATGMGEAGESMWSFIAHLILPSITLSTIPMANFSRITRASMLEVMNQDYITAAKAKGVSRFFVTMKHGFKNALTPILTVAGMEISSLLGGAVLTETIFSWPGMGQLVVEAINKRDYIVVQGSVIFLAVLYVLINLIVDVLYKVVNPKISYDQKGGE
ncbi:ABC transporter permease [Sporolactobacillus terrae]|uniref:Glutathione ABC transporter permease GsiC n=1 Tax=Sporolactobacillus terrae TaxID=269673 RepID=A0ABX5Q4Q5_9BACL|nr:ABC transporter permease [Sporolactobacillus terrae]QAA21625.1 glutathione ABC transporter permease GsiC [Sporolactobacillus terrae]QAA24597.1 glutathione ABC transporter permease GsiC [Sporolactobacillus terrae]UAK16434.1 ABC transporter permease [Sporolactobacillus terrae]